MKQNGLKIGSQTGSVMNYLMSTNNTEPKIGEGATELLWSDRHAWTVIEVSEDKKACRIQRCDSKRTDSNGYYTESQDYDYNHHLNVFMNLIYRNGAWRQVKEEIVWTDEFREEFTKIEKDFGWEHAMIACCTNELKNEQGCWKLVKGKTRIKRSFPKISILFGQRQEYRDPTF